MSLKVKKWLKPVCDFDDEPPIKTDKRESTPVKEVEEVIKKILNYSTNEPTSRASRTKMNSLLKKIPCKGSKSLLDSKTWMKHFEPDVVQDLAVNNKKIAEVEEFLKSAINSSSGNILLLSGPVGCGKTATIKTLANKYHIKVTEWITPMDIDLFSEYGDYEFREKQSTKFMDFVIQAANFSSLLDNNTNKLVLVEDFPNIFMKTPSEFTEVLNQYKQRAKSPIVFICSESHADNKNSSLNLFTPSLKEQCNVHHIIFNSVSATGLRAALKRVTEIISKKFTASHNIPTTDLSECVVNSSGGDVRSAVLNLHFACLKGSSHNLETSFIAEKMTKGKKPTKKKTTSSKFLSLGKNQTVSILHGVGRVLNPKIITTHTGEQKLSHTPKDVIEQFISQPNSFVNFLEENYLPHFANIDDADKAASSISSADFMLAEWREKMCQEYGLYTAVAGLMLSNKSPVSAWNPVRGPKNMRVQYPSLHEMPQLDQNFLYKGKVLVSDYQTYCKIIGM